MGQRSQTETVVAIYQGFLERRTWKQAELAKEIGIGTEPLRRILFELLERGMPLERQEEHPHVYWSVPAGWFPGALLLKRDEIPELLRQLRRLPAGPGRKRLFDLVASRLPAAAGSAAPVVVPREATPNEEEVLPVVEDSAEKGATLWMRYYSHHRGDVNDRHASVHRVLLGPPVRFVATCHRSRTLKTFRVENVMQARLDTKERYRAIDDSQVEAYVRESLDGFHEGGKPVELSFLVSNPDARWVKKNLLPGMVAESTEDGIRVTTRTAALRRLARFVVQLGGAATPESPSLAKEVSALARGALAAIEAATRSSD